MLDGCCGIDLQFALPELVQVGLEEYHQVLSELRGNLTVRLQVCKCSGGGRARLPETRDDLIILAQHKCCGNGGLLLQLMSNLLAQENIDRATRRADQDERRWWMSQPLALSRNLPNNNAPLTMPDQLSATTNNLSMLLEILQCCSGLTHESVPSNQDLPHFQH